MVRQIVLLLQPCRIKVRDKIMYKDSELEAAAKRAYYANYKELATGRYPPAWEDTSEEVRKWVRRQARNVLFGKDDFPKTSGQAR